MGKVYDLIIDRHLDEEFFNKLYKYLIDKYNYMLIQPRSPTPLLRLIPFKRGRPFIKQLILAITTIITVFMTGYGISYFFYELVGVRNYGLIIAWSVAYTILFMTALGIHEFGHMIASRKSGVIIEGPYFIPAPPIQLGFIGTLGAVISMKTLPPTRKDLARIGVAGPLSGYIAALIIGVIGVYLSPIIPISLSQKLVESGQASEIGFMPLIMILLFMIKNIPLGYTILLHPLAFISFIIFIVTFLNLLPIGQLDGGHVVRSFTSPQTHDLIGYFVIILTASIGILFINELIGQYYLALSIILVIFKLIFGRGLHPGPANQYSDQKDYLALATYIFLLITTTPLPV